MGGVEPSYGPEGVHGGTNPTCPLALDKLTTWYNDLLVAGPQQSGYGGVGVPQ